MYLTEITEYVVHQCTVANADCQGKWILIDYQCQQCLTQKKQMTAFYGLRSTQHNAEQRSKLT